MSDNIENKEKKPRKSRKNKESKLNKVNNDYLFTPLTNKKEKNNLLKIHFDKFIVDNVNTSQYITQMFGNTNNNLNGVILHFFYSEKLEEVLPNEKSISNDLKNNKSVYYSMRGVDVLNKVNNYLLNLKKSLKDALKINTVLNGIRQSITYLDRQNEWDIITELPRFKRLQRLKQLYETVVRIGLTLIHNFYWQDITENLSSDDNTLDKCIEMASPYIIKLKHEMEDLVKKEFSYDADEEKIIMSNRNY